jgi:Uma2 family endonuclease
MADGAERLVTVDEFLAFEGGGDTRYQLVRGVITAMAPARLLHGEMVGALTGSIRGRLPRHCRVIVEAGIRPPERNDTHWQADLVVNCRPRQPGEIYVEAPTLVIEVLSPSTEATDRLLKLADYRRMASVQHILLVAIDAVAIEHWRRAGDLWQVRDLGPGDLLTVDDLGITIELDDLYADMLSDMGEGGSES